MCLQTSDCPFRVLLQGQWLGLSGLSDYFLKGSVGRVCCSAFQVFLASSVACTALGAVGQRLVGARYVLALHIGRTS